MQPCADAGAESQKLFLCYVIELIKMPQYYSTKYYNTKAREKYLIIFSFFFPQSNSVCMLHSVSSPSLHVSLCGDSENVRTSGVQFAGPSVAPA